MISFFWHTIHKLGPQGTFSGALISVTKQLWYWAISVCTLCSLLYFQRLQCSHFSSFSVSLVTNMEMPPWTYASAWHLWKLHDLMPSIISHFKASMCICLITFQVIRAIGRVNCSVQKYLCFFASQGQCSQRINHESAHERGAVVLYRNTTVLALAAGTNIHPRPQWS